MFKSFGPRVKKIIHDTGDNRVCMFMCMFSQEKTRVNPTRFRRTFTTGQAARRLRSVYAQCGELGNAIQTRPILAKNNNIRSTSPTPHPLRS